MDAARLLNRRASVRRACLNGIVLMAAGVIAAGCSHGAPTSPKPLSAAVAPTVGSMKTVMSPQAVQARAGRVNAARAGAIWRAEQRARTTQGH
jgi:hypothetical protein